MEIFDSTLIGESQWHSLRLSASSISILFAFFSFRLRMAFVFLPLLARGLLQDESAIEVSG